MDSYKSDVVPDVNAPPLLDTVASISWANNSSTIFASSGWDGSLRIHEVVNGNYQHTIAQRLDFKFAMPALHCCWYNDNSQVFVGLADGSLKSFDINTKSVVDIGNHGCAVSSLHSVPGQNALISTGYDTNVFIWQLGTPTPAMNRTMDGKVFASDFQYPLLGCALSGERVALMDVTQFGQRTLIQPNQCLGRYSPLQCIAIHPKANHFGIGSIDGRANILSVNRGPQNNYVSSNKTEEGGNIVMYPVNAVGYNPMKEKWFMTAGSDGCLQFWDFDARNKIKTLNYGGVPLTTAKVSPSGDKIAYALGNDWHIGQEGVKWAPKLGVHIITEQETRISSLR